MWIDESFQKEVRSGEYLENNLIKKGKKINKSCKHVEENW